MHFVKEREREDKMEERIFCEECRGDVTFYTIEKKMKATIKGKNYTYFGKEAHCTQCHAAVYVEDIHDANLKALYDSYRKKNGIIAQSTIMAIPEKYAIGKRPLSLLLGWGEQTFSRYYDGDLPTRQYSDILQRIYDDPTYYEQLLETNRDVLKTSAYEKSRAVLNDILGKEQLSKKIDAVIFYILRKCGDITPLALQKALYYMQGFYYAFYKDYLFNEECEAWVHGPVYREVYDKYHTQQFLEKLPKEQADDSRLSESEKGILDGVIAYLCCYSGNVLEMFTHKEAPWLTARGDLPLSIGCERTIQKEWIGAYFQSVKERYDMQHPDDIKHYAKDMFTTL